MILREALERRLGELHRELGFLGATAAIALPNGDLTHASVGLADLERAEPMRRDQRMPAASIGKTFVAAAALRLQREGRIDLDQPVFELLGHEPWWPRLPNATSMTLRHLLSHSAGLEDRVFDSASREEAQKRRSRPDDEAWFRPHELVSVLLDREPLFASGEGFHYTDTGYIVAGLALETACGDVMDFIDREFLTPLGLGDTEVQLGRRYERLAAGYLSLSPNRKVADGGTMTLHPRTEWTGGGFVSCSTDLARWARALYGGSVLSHEEVEAMLGSGFREAGSTVSYGLGVFLETTEYGTVHGHGGWFPGWRSTLYRHRESGISVAAQINVSEPDHRAAVRDALFDLALAE